MEKVSECVDRILPIFQAYTTGQTDAVARLAQEISELEHEADQLKHDIQSQVPRGMFLPVDRDRLLEILAIQDSLADKAENLAVLLTLRQTSIPARMKDPFQAFLAKNLEAFEGVHRIIKELDELMSSGFGGVEAEKVRLMVMDVAKLEYEADLIQHDLLRQLFANEDDLSVADFFLLDKILKQISEFSNLSERLAHRVQRAMDLK
jgi:predicted phosphate transport protein (TIGR00153 family)